MNNRICIYLPAELLSELQAQAVKEGRSVSNLIALILRDSPRRIALTETAVSERSTS